MSFSCGIVGLPNIGKSTLFNAITNLQVESSNYPFCTIEPNKGVVTVPDPRLESLAKINNSEKVIPTTIEIVDIAGLVKGASQGEGLGNKFLSHVRQVDAIIQVVRLFRDPVIVRENPLSPIEDIGIINTELILADLETVEKRIQANQKLVERNKDRGAIALQRVYEKCQKRLLEEKMIYGMEWSAEDKKIVKQIHLLTIKPMLLAINVDENDLTSFKDNDLYKKIIQYAKEKGWEVVPLCARTEDEISQMDEKMAKEYQELLGFDGSGLSELIKKSYKILSLITFLTSGEQETKAWTIPQGTLAPQAAGVIHSDFEKGFIKVEVVPSQTLIELGSMNECRKAGKLRIEGKGYEVQDGDVCLFRFNN